MSVSPRLQSGQPARTRIGTYAFGGHRDICFTIGRWESQYDLHAHLRGRSSGSYLLDDGSMVGSLGPAPSPFDLKGRYAVSPHSLPIKSWSAASVLPRVHPV